MDRDNPEYRGIQLGFLLTVISVLNKCLNPLARIVLGVPFLWAMGCEL